MSGHEYPVSLKQLIQVAVLEHRKRRIRAADPSNATQRDAVGILGYENKTLTQLPSL